MYMIILMLFVFDLQSWDVSMVHVLPHCMSGLHWLFRDVCMFVCALLLTLDRLVCAWFMYWFWCPYLFWIVKCFEPSSWIRRYIKVTYYFCLINLSSGMTDKPLCVSDGRTTVCELPFLEEMFSEGLWPDAAGSLQVGPTQRMTCYSAQSTCQPPEQQLFPSDTGSSVSWFDCLR